MLKLASKNGVKVTKSLIPWWIRKIYLVLSERFSMATSSIVPDNGSDGVVCIYFYFYQRKLLQTKQTKNQKLFNEPSICLYSSNQWMPIGMPPKKP